MGVASHAARAELEEMMLTKEYKNDFFDRAEAKGKAESLMTILSARNIGLSAEQHELVASCLDLAQLSTWTTRAATATSADDVFTD